MAGKTILANTLDARDVTFDGTGGPRQGEASVHRRPIRLNAASKAHEWRESTSSSILEPGVEITKALTPDQAPKTL